MRAQKLLPVIATVLTLGCSDQAPTEPRPQPLTGHWISQRFALGESASYEHHLTLSPFLKFVSEARNYGSYPGQGPDDFSGYTRVEGTYRVDGDRLQFRPLRQVSWDLFYGQNSPVQVIEPYPYGTLFDGARFEIVAERLTLHYLSYPLDAPVATTLELSRILDSTQ
jgi:hypothetical protein